MILFGIILYYLNKKKFNMIIKILLSCFLFITINICTINNVYAKGHLHYESAYQHAWCSQHNGIEEYQNSDYTRVDCLTEKYAVEFDFSNKWAECVGQAQYYGLITNKIPKCVLILDGENWKTQLIYFNRIKKLSNKYNFSVEFITDDILK